MRLKLKFDFNMTEDIVGKEKILVAKVFHWHLSQPHRLSQVVKCWECSVVNPFSPPYPVGKRGGGGRGGGSCAL